MIIIFSIREIVIECQFFNDTLNYCNINFKMLQTTAVSSRLHHSAY